MFSAVFRKDRMGARTGSAVCVCVDQHGQRPPAGIVREFPYSHRASLLPFLGHRGPRALDAVSLGAPGAPLGLSRIYSVPQAINASRGFARCEGVSQIRVGRVKIKRMSLHCPPYSFHRQSDCKSERQPYPPLLCVHFRGPPGHHRRVLRVDTRKTLHLYGPGC